MHFCLVSLTRLIYNTQFSFLSVSSVVFESLLTSLVCSTQFSFLHLMCVCVYSLFYDAFP
jgi:hypothetical protein